MTNLLASILVFGTGLVLLIEFHVGDGAHRPEFSGLSKGFWLDIHQAAVIGFLICFLAHIQRHWKHVIRRRRYIVTARAGAIHRDAPRSGNRPTGGENIS